MTYREKAIERLTNIGINGYNAEDIVNCYIAEEFATNVFNGFAQDNEDNWDNEFKMDTEDSANE